MKLDDILQLKEDNQIVTSNNAGIGGTTSDSVAKWIKPVDNKKGSDIIKRANFIDYAINKKEPCPACEFIKKNKNLLPLGFNSHVKCFLCDKEFGVYPGKKKENMEK